MKNGKYGNYRSQIGEIILKHWKRFSALVLTLALLAALAVPASAAVSSFDDITDAAVGIHADVLRFMGVVSGKGGNHFAPNDTLTRAEFCAMTVGIMGRTGEVAGELNRTIFTDVTSTHWARGYVNLAASITIGKDSATRLISGVGGGRFAPDDEITFGQAATILVRVLGYTDEQVGHVWPGDYVAKAGEIGLSAGVNASPNGSLTRAQAAQMFVNLLSCKKSNSSSYYYETLGDATRDTILLSVNAELNGARGAVMTSAGTYLPANNATTLPTSFVGQKGVQVVKNGLMVAFIPDSSKTVTVTLTAAAGSTSLKASNGTTYTVSPTATVYAGENKSTYGDIFGQLTSGTQVTLYLTNGKVDGLYYAGASSSVGEDAIVVSGSASEAMFHQLTGGATGYRILKDRQEIAFKDIKENDVVTYDPVSNALLVSDLRITVGYMSADNTRAPKAVKVNGISGTNKDGTFEVLDCAVDSMASFRVNDTVTLLLTADGRVARAVTPASKVRSTAVGLVGEGNQVHIPLPAGGYLTSDALSGALYGQLVTLSSSRSGLSGVRLANKPVSMDFDVEKMTLGAYKVAAGAALYERVGANGAAVPLDLTGLDITTIPANKISTYSLNSSDMVDVLVVDNLTGNALDYGILVEGEKVQSGGGGLTATNRTVTVQNGTKGMKECLTGMTFAGGTYGGVAVGGWDELNGIHRAASIVTLTEVKNVPASAFFTANGVTYVSVSGRVYPVAVGVVCRNLSQINTHDDNGAGGWLSGEDALDEALKIGDTFTLYVDPVGEMVRIVTTQSR